MLCVVPRDTAETDHPDQGPAASGGHIAVCQHRHHQLGPSTISDAQVAATCIVIVSAVFKSKQDLLATL